MTNEAIPNEKKNIFEKSEPEVMDCLRKEYDGTSNMSAEA